MKIKNNSCKILLIFVGVFTCMFAHAQLIELSPLQNNFSEYKNTLQLIGNSEIGSTTFSATIFKKYIQNSFLNDDDKQFIDKRKNDSQRFGFETNYGVSYFFKPDSVLKKKNKIAFIIHVEQKQILSIMFTDDVLKTVLEGNSKYVGDSLGIRLSPTVLENYKFQKAGAGVVLNLSNDASIAKLFFVRVSFVNGQKFQNLSVHNSTIRFADSTYAMSGNIDLLSYKTPTNNAYFASNGKGTALDFGVSYKSSNLSLTAMASDVGFVKWNQLSRLKVDTNFTYSGYKIDLKQLLNDSTYKVSADSIFNVSKHKTVVNSRATLPYTIRLNAQYNWANSKFSTALDFAFKKQIAFYDRISVVQYFHFNKQQVAGILLALGGYTKTQYGILYTIKLKKLSANVVIINPHSYFFKNALPIAGLNMLVGYSW